jgi:glycosyltransferase involved in cell wall biosynthesis
VLQLELPYAAGSAPTPCPWDGTLRLVIFGYLAANRRLDAILDAIASFPQRDRLRLDILGQLQDPEATEQRIRELGLAPLVTMRGYVPERELDELLERSHLALNLRYPTMGEASGSQLRLWSRGLPSVVSRTGWYAELPADAVWFVDPLNEIGDLHRHFSAALSNPDVLRTMGEAGRRHLEQQHAPAAYAEALRDGLPAMMRAPESIIGEVTDTVGGVLAASRMDRPAKMMVANTVASELATWVRGGRD